MINILLPCVAVLLTLEAVSLQAQTQPTNSLSITSYGASTGSSDNTTAIQNCINAAESQGKSVWVPAGTWNVKGSLNSTGITIAGAGMTSSIIYKDISSGGSQSITITRGTVQDLGVDSNARTRSTAPAGFNIFGVGWLMERVKVEHSNAGMWASGSSGTIDNCIVTNTYADGLNINNSDGPNGLGVNLTIQNCKGYSAGDDEFAINSQIPVGSGRINMQNAKIINCISSGAYAANGLRIAGGTNSQAINNFITNAYQSDIICGIFGGEGSIGGVVSNAVISGNICVGGGTNNDSEAGIRLQDNAIASVTGNTVLNTVKYGITMSDGFYQLGNNTVNHPGLTGIWVKTNAKGGANIYNNTVENLNSGQSAYVNSASGTFAATLTGNSWQGGSGSDVASASADNPPNETAAMAFDGSTSTKWFNANAGNTGWLQYQFGSSVKKIVNRYDLSSANDVPGRDPKNWQFQGSQDGSSWTTLDTQSNQTFANRLQTNPYPIGNTTAYNYYRLNITANNGDPTGIQLSEMAFGTTSGGTAAASADNPPNETAAMAFDGSSSTKWFNANAGNTGWLQYHYASGVAWTVTGYNLSSANDTPGRDPKNWQFQGSHDGSNWTTLDTQSNQTFANRFQTNQYPISNTTAYEYYRLNITANNGDPTGIQLSEMVLMAH